MDVVVYNAEVNIDELEKVGEIFDLLEEKGYVIMEVIADEQNITNYSSEQIEDIKPIDKLEIVVKEVEELTQESLDEAEKYIPRLISGIDEIIDKFSQGLEKQGYNSLTDCIEGFQWINAVVVNLEGSNLNQETDNLEELINKWDKQLQEFLTAMENQDIVLLTDVLEYELVPILKQYLEIIKNR